MILKIEPLTICHINSFHTDSQSFKEDMEFNLQHPILRQAYAILCPLERVVLGVVGASCISNGVWEGWFYLSRSAGLYAKSIVQTCITLSDFFIKKDIHRLQIAVRHEHRKWAKALGFHFECIVKNYHSNIDHYMYVKLRG